MHKHEPLPLSKPPRRWPVALFVAFVNGVAGAALCLPVALWGMEIHHASHFEGSSDFGVAFIWMPLAAIIGFAVGFATSFCTRRRGFGGYLFRQSMALLTIAVTIVFGGGIAYALADHPHPPLINGKELALEIELRVPASGRTIADLKALAFDARVDAERDYKPESALFWKQAVTIDDFLIIPIWASLHSQTTAREIAVWDAHDSWHTFKLRTPAQPQNIDEAWSDWMVSKFPGADHKRPPLPECHARYRVRFAAERPVDP